MSTSMKRKNQIPLPEPAILQLQAQAADDSSLPKPRGFGKLEVAPAHGECTKLQATKQFGGLLPVGRGSQYWQCPSCGAIRADRQLVAACCQQIPNQVQICPKCLRIHNQALRIGECQCNQRDFIIRDSKTQLLLYGHQALKASVRNNRSEELLVFRIP